jgi:DNA-binding NarL/FixJ family response regulator
MTTIRVLVADDQKVVRDGLCLLVGMLPGVEVIGAAVDGEDAIRRARWDVPDVVLMDLHMPNCDGVEATRRIVRDQPSVRVVALTAYSDDERVFGALRAGARGYLTKDASAGEILQAVATVCAGNAQLDPSVQRMLVDAIAQGARVGLAGFGVAGTGVAGTWVAGTEVAGTGVAGTGVAGTGVAGAGGSLGGRHKAALAGLTEREVDVLTAIGSGLSNAEICARFRISAATVKTHVNHLLAKTGMRDRAQLVGYAFRQDLVR